MILKHKMNKPMKPHTSVDPKFKKGDRVYAETLGAGTISDSYRAASKPYGEWLYHIKQKGFLLGNVPESYIHLLQ